MAYPIFPPAWWTPRAGRHGLWVLERGLEVFAVAPAARHALCSYFDQLAVLVHSLIAQKHPTVITEVGSLLLMGIGARMAPGMGYTSLVHSDLRYLWAGSRGVGISRGAISFPT